MAKPVYQLKAVYRITTFIPLESLEWLLEGISRVVPLQYGNYDHVLWWSTVGIEQFRPLEGSNPTVGREGQIERQGSIRVEFTIPRDPSLLDRVLTDGLLLHHPWEQPVVVVDEAMATLKPLKEEPREPCSESSRVE